MAVILIAQWWAERRKWSAQAVFNLRTAKQQKSKVEPMSLSPTLQHPDHIVPGCCTVCENCIQGRSNFPASCLNNIDPLLFIRPKESPLWREKKMSWFPGIKNKKQGLSLRAKKGIFVVVNQVVRWVAMGTIRGLGLNVRLLFNYFLFSFCCLVVLFLPTRSFVLQEIKIIFTLLFLKSPPFTKGPHYFH